MIRGGIGGANTQTGIRFEGTTDLAVFLQSITGYKVMLHADHKSVWYIFFEEKLVGHIFRKQGLYKHLAEQGIVWNGILSKQLLPDDCLYVLANNTFFIVECKFQQVEGSVDEKLQTCDFKKKQYRRLLAPLNVEVEYIYLLNDWFKKPAYKDVLDYIIHVGCHYYFNYIPLQKLGLPVSTVANS